MSNVDRIRPTDKSIYTYLEELRNGAYQIPTFQREVVWEKENVKKLWDSIYKFYPLGSILIWKTRVKLQNIREIGGHIISEDDSYRFEYQYILDGQQRTTALLTSLYGGKIGGKGDFDPTLYIDLTVQDQEEIDDESFRKRFLFWDEIDDDNGRIRQNIGRKKRFEDGLIVKLRDIKEKYGDVERVLVEGKGYQYDHHVRKQLRRMKEVLDNYRLSIIELREIKVPEVCQIFERINQAGKPLNIFDIVVAKTFQPAFENKPGFDLRELIDEFRKENEGNYIDIDYITYLQILAVLINIKNPDAGVKNITDRYLNEIRTEHIKDIWEKAKVAILKTFDFFDNHLRLKGPSLIPFRYFYMTIASYFFENDSPDYNFLTQYFWYYSFHNDDLLRNTTHLWKHVEFLHRKKEGEEIRFDKFILDKEKLRIASYSRRGRLSRAILALFANQDPRDWSNPAKSVLNDVYYVLTDKPNLHHVFPINFIKNHPGRNKLDANSLMNIVYLTQITNLKISDENPIEYLRKFDSPEFEEIIENHLLPEEILKWARKEELPENALDLFIERRADKIIDKLRAKITLAEFEVIDTIKSGEI